MKSPGKAEALSGVVDYLLDIQQRFTEPTEEERLLAWAHWARPGDCLMLDVRGFRLAGFQFLRMLFGAETVKPDVHILKYVQQALGRPVSSSTADQVRAVYALERAGELLQKPIRTIDVVIWKRGAGVK